MMYNEQAAHLYLRLARLATVAGQVDAVVAALEGIRRPDRMLDAFQAVRDNDMVAIPPMEKIDAALILLETAKMELAQIVIIARKETAALLAAPAADEEA